MDKRKQASIEQAAAELFFSAGYEATSMDKIAVKACVSKATLYSYYGDKRKLFEAVIRSVSAGQRKKRCPQIGSGDWRPALVDMAASLLCDLVSPPTMGAFRAIVGSPDRFPEISGLFYEAAVGSRRAEARRMLEALVDRGLLSIGDIPRAADVLVDLLIGAFYLKKSLGLANDESLSRVAEGAVETFLEAFAPAAAERFFPY